MLLIFNNEMRHFITITDIVHTVTDLQRHLPVVRQEIHNFNSLTCCYITLHKTNNQVITHLLYNEAPSLILERCYQSENSGDAEKTNTYFICYDGDNSMMLIYHKPVQNMIINLPTRQRVSTSRWKRQASS